MLLHAARYSTQFKLPESKTIFNFGPAEDSDESIFSGLVWIGLVSFYSKVRLQRHFLIRIDIMAAPGQLDQEAHPFV